MSTSNAVQHLRTLQAVRQQAQRVFQLVKDGKSEHFAVDESKIGEVAQMVAGLARSDYAALSDIPYHSRFRHFEAGKIDRLAEFHAKCTEYGFDHHERVRALIDLIVVSVLLDAGAGMQWKYFEASTNAHYNRSEGLGVACFRMFMDGLFSDDAEKPLRVTGAALDRLQVAQLSDGFQVSEENPMHGLHGRCDVVKAMGRSLSNCPEYFEREGLIRPGNVYDYLLRDAVDVTDASTGEQKKKVELATLWRVIMEGFQQMWPADRLQIDGVNMGDVWENALLEKHAAELGGDVDLSTAKYSPFHKLSQWLTYSLLEALENSGFEVAGSDLLTGLPEYRNGGLLLDKGVLVLKNPEAVAAEAHTAGAQLIIEWRSLTVHLLDRVAEHVREILGVSKEQLPLAKVLEAGTWKAGRIVAKELRSDGGPPIAIISDGTVF